MSKRRDTQSGDRIRVLDGETAGVRRMEAFFHGAPFSLHRHDSYAIGVTRFGIQCFFYRGSWHHARRGQIHILYPDELHDGAAGTEDGFGYRIAYIDPWLLQQAIGGRELPFVRNPVQAPNAAWRSFLSKVWQADVCDDEMLQAEFAAEAVDCLEAAAGNRPANRRGPIAMRGLNRAREAIADNPVCGLSATELELLADMDRWSLARGFRAAFGTSPTRYRTMRRLERVRDRIAAGMPLSQAALDAGFSDQSHMTRRFREAFGMSPRQWKLANRGAPLDAQSFKNSRRLHP
jgi:AraC-like DNA-binding protein